MKKVNVNKRRSTADRMKTNRNICIAIYTEYTTLISDILDRIVKRITKDLAKQDKTFENYQLGEKDIFKKYDKIFERHWKITEGRLRKNLPQIRRLWVAYMHDYICFDGFGGKDKDLLIIYKGLQTAVGYSDNQVIDILLDKKRLKGETAAHDKRAMNFILNDEQLEDLYT